MLIYYVWTSLFCSLFWLYLSLCQQTQKARVNDVIFLKMLIITAILHKGTVGYVYINGKGICLKSRYPCDYTCSSDFTSPGSGRTTTCNYWSNLTSVHQVPITAGWTEEVWSTKFAPTLLHITSTGNQTPDLLILSPTPYPLGHMLP